MYIFLGIDVDDQFSEVKKKAELIDKRINFKNSCFTLPLHISLKASFKIDYSNFDNIIEEIINYYLSIQPFDIDIYQLEMYDNIIWIRMCRNEELDKVHDDLNKLLLEKYNISLHEYDLDYKYHTTLFMDDNIYNIKNAYNLMNKIDFPKSIMANQFIIGVSETGKLGSYSIYRKIKILDTSSSQCKILKDGNKKYVIRYPRDIGVVREYYRFTPESDVIDLLEKNSIKVPKSIKTTAHYLVQEYIEGDLLADIFQDHKDIDRDIINEIIDQICFLAAIDYAPLLKYASWIDNRSFYNFQCNNTLTVFQNYYQSLNKLYDKLGISSDILDILSSYSAKIDNNRDLSIIHGDRHKKNIILQSNGKIIFIDWELGGVADLAYDVAFHLHQMAYTKKDETFFINRLEEKYIGDFNSLLKDIKLYSLFILARSCIYHVYWTNLMYQEGNDLDKKKQLGHFMRRYNKLSKFPEFNLSYKSEEELDDIFKRFSKD